MLEESLKKEKTNMVDQFFDANQSAIRNRNVPISQVYERYNLISPYEANKSKNEGEGEDERQENPDGSIASAKVMKGVFGQ